MRVTASGEPGDQQSVDVHVQLARGTSALEQLCARFVETGAELDKTKNDAVVDGLRVLRLQIVEALMGFSGPIGQPLAQALSSVTAICLKLAIRSHARSPQEEELFARCRAALAAARPHEAAAPGLAALLLAWHAFELDAFPPVAAIPGEIRPAWLTLMLESPPAFAHRGDGVRFAHYLQRLCLWLQQYLDVTPGLTEDVMLAFFRSTIFLQSYFNELNLRDVMRARGALIEEFLERGDPTLDQLRVLRPARSRPRIGFIALYVADGTETAFLAAHLERLDRRRFDVRLYSINPPAGRLGAVCRAAAETFVQLPNRMDAAVARLRGEDLDIALFCTNLTAGAHLLTLIAAHRVAPIQAANCASPVTTGLRNIDYMIGGELNETQGAEAHYSERLVMMPGALNCYAFDHMLEGLAKPSPASRSAAGVPERGVLFFSTANYYKIQPELSALWFQILLQVPDSYLMLMPFNPNWSTDYQVVSFYERMRRQTAEAGVSLNRLLMHPPVPTIAHLHRIIELADVYLDAFPFSGACSIYDVMKVAVPLVVRSGTVSRARHSTAILQAEGLGDLVAQDDEAYIERAVELGRHPEKRAAERQRMTQARDAGLKLVDTAHYAAMLKPVFDEMVSDWNRRVQALRAMKPAALAQRIGAAASDLAPRVASFTDRDLIVSVVLPYLRNGGSRRLIDIGACMGVMTAAFVSEGWQAVMFEPDQRCHPSLAKMLDAFPGQIRTENAAVTADQDGHVAFHVASVPGLSGLSHSPLASDLAIIEVRTVALSRYIARNGLFDVDFIKIDAEGHDFAILDGIDFGQVAPRLVMVEFGDQFAGQDRAAIEAALQRMRAKAYRSCVVCLRALGDMTRHEWGTSLLAIGVDAVPALPADASLFGNILFFREEDSDFLPSLADWLDQFADRKRRGLAPQV